MSHQLVGRNKKAFHEYEILDRFEAGVVLQGTEVKAIREHKVADPGAHKVAEDHRPSASQTDNGHPLGGQGVRFDEPRVAIEHRFL